MKNFYLSSVIVFFCAHDVYNMGSCKWQFWDIQIVYHPLPLKTQIFLCGRLNAGRLNHKTCSPEFDLEISILTQVFYV